MKRNAKAVWEGEFKQGKGSLDTESGVLKQTPYSFRSRFEDGKETNPEELIAAAHAGCFTMALSAFLGKAGFKPEKLTTEAALSLDQDQGGGWTITTIQLTLKGKVPDISAEQFKTIAMDAKANCPVSRVLNAKISLDASLE
jgi:osmotically inducible protein OsmC